MMHLGDLAASGPFPKYVIPDRIVFVDDLPKTTIGKIDKKSVRAQYADL